MRRTKAQALDTRAMILDAAESVFFSCGVTLTTLNKIADAAGVTRGAIYWHFKNKEAVFEAIFERFAAPLDPFAIPLAPDEINPLGRLREELEERLLGALRETRTRRIYTIVFARCEATEETTPFCRRVYAASRLAEAQIERALRHAVLLEQVSADVNVSEAALFIHATLAGVLRQDLLNRRYSTALDPSKIISMTFQCLTRP